MPIPERTKEAALSVLLDARASVRAEMVSNSDLFSEDLLREVFEQAWKAQFEQERRHARREVRELVSDFLTRADLEDLA